MEVVRLFLEHSEFDINTSIEIRQLNGEIIPETLAHTACMRGHHDIVRVLREYGADLDAKSRYDITPLQLATQSGHVETVRLLCEHGVNLNVRTQDAWGCTPVHSASSWMFDNEGMNFNDIVDRHANILRLLYEFNADVTIKDKHQKTALEWACAFGKATAVHILCVYGAKLADPMLPRWVETIAKAHGHEEIRKYLENTRGYANPLDYSKFLTMDEATYWLKSSRLSGFPRHNFVHGGTETCDFIKSALVWSVESATLFPASCRRRAREILLIPWSEKGLKVSVLVSHVLPFVIDRCSPAQQETASNTLLPGPGQKRFQVRAHESPF